MTPPEPIPRDRVYFRPIFQKWLVCFTWIQDGISMERVLCRPSHRYDPPYWSDGTIPNPMIQWDTREQAEQALDDYYKSKESE